MIGLKHTRLALLSLIFLPGCVAGSKQATRPDDPADLTSWSAGKPEKPIGDDGSLNDGKGMLKNNRLRGTWSSEAAEIERSLGVGR